MAKRAVPRTLAYFALTYAVVNIAITRLADAGGLLAVQEWTAVSANWLLRAFGIRSVISGTAIACDGGIVNVDGACMPIPSLAIGLALLMFLTDPTVASKLMYSLVLLIVLMAANTARIALVAGLVNAGSELMHPVHATVTPVLLVAISVGVWLIASRSRRHVQA